MVCWRYASSRVVVAGLGRMGSGIGFGPRTCARARRRQAHDYRGRAGLLRAGEIGSIENKTCGLPVSQTGSFGSGSAQVGLTPRALLPVYLNQRTSQDRLDWSVSVNANAV